MILLTGATGLVGSALLDRLLAAGQDVRCMVRDPRRLGPNRVRVQITMGDLANPFAVRQAVRGVDTVAHLAATIRDQPSGSIEELNSVATIRLLREARQAGARRFLFFGAAGASTTSPARFFRAKALAEQAVLESGLDATVLAPSIVYAPGDPWLTLLRRLSWLPWMPVAGFGRGRLSADLGGGRGGLRRARAERAAAERKPIRAGWPGDPHLRADRPARARRMGPTPGRSSTCRCRSCTGAPAWSRASAARRHSRPGRRRS